MQLKKKSVNSDRIFEDTVAGAAALTIGLYGYYNDHHGIFSKIIYSATQTAGIYMISDAIFRSSKPSLTLEIDRHFKEKNTMTSTDFINYTVRHNNQLELAQHKKNAYSAAILALLYGYNGSREQSNQSLKNVFYFLTFDFVLISGVSFYKVYTFKPTTSEPSKKSGTFNLSVLPTPTITYTF